MKQKYEVAIIGGGPAGLAAALSCKKNGLNDILIIERDERLGGILNQCIHNGFGLHYLKKELTGPEYAQHFIDEVLNNNIEYLVNSMVVDINKEKEISFINREGYHTIKTKSIILAMGCRERPRGALNIPGFRPAGIYTAGTAQKLINIDGLEVGKEVVILGSGDIGLIMARRMSLEGCHVNCVCEVMPYSSGLKRNIVQCLDDFDIPLLLKHTVVNIKGKKRVESVVVAEVDDNRKPIKGTEKEYKCDTLLLSVGLLPENELSKKIGIELSKDTSGAIVDNNLETSIDGVFACGNVLHVHDLVDNVSKESEDAGLSAARYVLNNSINRKYIDIIASKDIAQVVPMKVNVNNIENDLIIRFRYKEVFNNRKIVVKSNGVEIYSKVRPICTPGEMEEIIINKEKLKNINDVYIELEGLIL